MREFILNSEDLLDLNAVRALRDGAEKELLPCHWVRWDDKIQIIFFTDGLSPLEERLPLMTLGEICSVGKRILALVRALENSQDLVLANLVLDTEGIYLDEEGELKCLCLPDILPEDVANSQIYVRRVYALLEEMLEKNDDERGKMICKRMDEQMEHDLGNWIALAALLEVDA